MADGGQRDVRPRGAGTGGRGAGLRGVPDDEVAQTVALLRLAVVVLLVGVAGVVVGLLVGVVVGVRGSVLVHRASRLVLDWRERHLLQMGNGECNTIQTRVAACGNFFQ